MVFDAMRRGGHERVVHVRDGDVGLEALVVLHDTTLGPALGGTRVMSYPSEDAALTDALRLARAMTYKAAAADLNLGGGKAVVVGDPDRVKTEGLLQAYGRAIDRLGGTYITTEDMNTTVADMDVVATETDYVVGTSDGLGDPSPVTAYGVVQGIRACLDYRYGDDSLTDVTVLVQGVGKVGHQLAADLVDADADVKIADPDPQARERVEAMVDGTVTEVDPAEALTEPCDVFAPCAGSHLGLGDSERLRDVIPSLPCAIVAGSANNALGDHEEALEHAAELAAQDVLYAPDYVVNAGGLVLTAHDWEGSTREAAYEDTEHIRDRLGAIIERAEEAGITTLAAANRYAETRFR